MSPAEKRSNFAASQYYVKVSCAALVALGTVALTGWFIGLPALTTLLLGTASMKANTALSMLLGGVSLWLLRERQRSKTRSSFGLLLALLVSTIGVLSVSEYIFGLNLGIDQLIVRDTVSGPGAIPGRMTYVTALVLLLSGSALALIDVENRVFFSVAQSLCIIAMAVSLTAISGHIVGFLSLYGFGGLESVPLHTACAVFVFSTSILLARPDRGIISVATADLPGGKLLRRLLPAAVAIPLFLGWIVSRGESIGVFVTREQTPILVVVLTFVFSILVWLSARSLNVSERLRSRLARIVETSDDAIFSTSTDGIIQSWNTGAATTLGYSSDEIIGSHISVLVPPELKGELEGILARISMGEHIDHFETERVRKNGTRLQASLTITPIRDMTGAIIGASTIARDISERRGAEQAIKESASRLAGIIGSAMDAIISVDEKQDIRLFNPAAEKMFGYQAQDVLGQPLSKLIPSRFREGHEAHIRHFGQTNTTRRSMGELGSIYGLHANGREFPIEASISQIDVAGQKLFTVILRDVSERTRAEQLIKENESRLVGIIGSAMDAIISVDGQQRIMLFNPAAEKMFGYMAQDVVNYPLEKLIPARFRSAHEGHIRRFGETNETKRTMGELGSIYGLRADGTEFPIEASISQVDVAGQKLFTVILRDVSERRRAEEALKKSQTELRMFVEQSPVSLAMFDRNMNYVVTSRRWIAEYGRGNTELVGRNHYEIHPDVPEEWKEAHRKGMAGTVLRNDEDLWIQADGSRHWLSWGVHPWLDEEGNIGGIIISAEDITERQVAKERIHQLNADLERRVVERTAELESANKELEAFSYSVSHDLRSPLRTMDGFSQALVEDFGGKLPEEGQRYVHKIRTGAQRMGELIDDLLTFSRLSRMPLNTVTVDTGRLVRDVLEELSLQRQGRNVDIRMDELPRCQGDTALLKQVWINLLSNALKYTSKRDRATIEIGCLHDNEGEVYFVRDNGTGFDMQYANKLFGVFQRLHRAEEYEGTGVGLAIVQRVVHRHGGRVWAESEVDHGATFYFTLNGGIRT